MKKPGASQSSAHADTQREATDRATEIVRNSGGGEVRIHEPRRPDPRFQHRGPRQRPLSAEGLTP
ncbi:DUF2188 domain-containing protein [Mycolicibacterium peregrinum]